MTAPLDRPAVTAPVRARTAAGLRSGLWRAVFSLTGGMTVAGALPRGGCVVVANHGSHADAPALLAALGAAPAPRVAAAADYWFSGGLRSRVCRVLVGGFAVRRSGGGAEDLAGAVALLRAGRAVVVFPEGTRSPDGVLGAFRSGAFRLAEQAGVPLVPVGLVGTRDVLAPRSGGRLRRAPVAVRIGPSVGSATAARDTVARLVAAPAPAPRSRLHATVRRLALSRRGTLLVLGWAVAVREALSRDVAVDDDPPGGLRRVRTVLRGQSRRLTPCARVPGAEQRPDTGHPTGGPTSRTSVGGALWSRGSCPDGVRSRPEPPSRSAR